MSGAPAISRYEEVARELRSGRFELFTCDVFDTLVWRPTARPTDLFVTLGQRLADDGMLARQVEPVDFSGARQWAEADARRLLRKATGSVECNLEEIWRSMPAAILSEQSIDRYVTAELDCEAEHLQLHAGTVEVLELARQLGVRTALASDSYLSPEQLGDVLARAGFDPGSVDRIVTSSAMRLGKSEGLLGKVAAMSRVDPRRMLHFGDNPNSDVAAAIEIGATAVVSEVAPDRRAVERPTAAVAAYSDRAGTDGALGAAVRETLVAAGSLADSAAYQFGAAIAGPALAGFACWASDVAEQHGVFTVHCLLREGAVLADLMTRTRPGGPTPRTVHASRWAMLRAAVFDGTPDEVFPVIERRSQFRPEHLCAAFDLEPGAVAAVLPEEEYHHDQRYEALEAVLAVDAVREQIVAESARHRRNVLRYFERVLDLSGERLVLCDIGWGGKIQATIDTILRSDGFTGEIVGLYMMLSETGVNRRRAGAIMHSYLPETTGSELIGPAGDVVQHHAAILERIATPPIGTLLEFSDSGEPICRPDDHDVHPPSLHLARQAVYDVTERLAEMAPLAGDTWRDRSFRAALLDGLAATIAEPSPLLAAELGEWQHDDLAGDGLTSLFAGDVAAVVDYLNAVDAATIGWERVFWLPGLAAAASPALTAQLAATRFGVEPSAITTTSETGQARIATFPLGSDLASHQTEGVPWRSPGGWHLLRLHERVPSSRSLRFDAGSESCLVHLGLLTVKLTTPDGPIDLGLTGFTDDRLQWIDGRPHSRTVAGFAAGGHLLLDLTAIAPTVTAVDIDWAFRTWALDDDELALARPDLATRARQLARRAVRAARRRA